MNYNKENNYSHNWIFKLENRYHWALYWHQINCLMNISKITKSNSIIEVGKGSGFTSNYLKNKGYQVITIDIDKNKDPDIVLDITSDEIPATDALLAFEIMEHIPYENVEKLVRTLSKNGTKFLIFSLPYAFKSFLWVEGFIINFGVFKMNLGRRRKKINSKHHHWELGIGGHSVYTIKALLNKYNFKMVSDYKYRNHHFFVTENNL